MTQPVRTTEHPGAAQAASVLEFNDAQLRLHRPGLPVQLSPVLAVADGNTVRVGDLAADARGVDARSGCDTYLSRLGDAVLGLRNAPHLTSADLLFAHLEQLVGAARIDTFVVSPAFDEAQLALLLGVAIRAGQQPVRVVDAAVAAAAVATRPGDCAYYLDIGRTGSVLVHVPERDGTLARGEVQHTSGGGMTAARDLWVRWIRERCVALWRIDPMFNPDSAGNILAAWPKARDALARGEGTALDIGPQQRLDWHSRAVLARLQQASRSIVDDVLARVPEHGVILLDARIKELPGLASTLARYRETRQLSVDAQAYAARAGDKPSSSAASAGATGIAHIQQLPRHEPGNALPDAQSAPWTLVGAAPVAAQRLLVALGAAAYVLAPNQPATLVVEHGDHEPRWLDSGSSTPVGALRLLLSAAADHVLLDCTVPTHAPEHAVRVNGRIAAQRNVLRAGDSIRIGQCSPFTILQLQDDGGTWSMSEPASASEPDDGR